MTIQQAIKSGKPFRRSSKRWQSYKHEFCWIEIRDLHEIPYFHYYNDELPDGIFGEEAVLLPSDILATDWEIKKEGGK